MNSDKETDKIQICASKSIVPFEEALNIIGIGKYNYLLLFIGVYTLLAAAADIFGVGLIIASAQCDLKLDVYKKGLIGAVPMLGVIASAHLWGYVADTSGRKFTLTITMSGTLTVSLISSFANNWIFLAVTKFFSAACASGSNAVIFAIMGESTPEYHRGKYMMYAVTGVMLSQGINAIMAYFILNLDFSHYLPFLDLMYRPWRLLALIFGLLNALNLLLLILFVDESPKYNFSVGNHHKGLCSLRKMYAMNTGNRIEEYPVEFVKLDEETAGSKRRNMCASVWYQTIPLFHRQHIKNTLLISYLCILSYSLAPPFVIWLPVIFGVYSESLDTDQSFCQLIVKNTTEIIAVNNTSIVDEVCVDQVTDFTLIGMGINSTYLVFITALSAVLIKYTGKKWMFIGSHIASGCLALFLDKVHSVWAVAVFICLMTTAPNIGVSTTYAVELFPTYLRAMAVCLTVMIGRAFSFIVINVMGVQLETNCENFFYMHSAFAFSGAVVGLLLPSEKNNKRPEIPEEDHDQNLEPKSP